jgi:hypothetical protein
VVVFAAEHRSPVGTQLITAGSYTHPRWRLCVSDPSAVSVPHASLTLCARWSFRHGVTSLTAVSGAFRVSSGFLETARLVFVVEPVGVGMNPRTEIGLWASPEDVGNHVRSDLTGWFAGGRLIAAKAGQPASWRLPGAYLSVEAFTENDHDAVFLAGSEGIVLTPNGE